MVRTPQSSAASSPGCQQVEHILHHDCCALLRMKRLEKRCSRWTAVDRLMRRRIRGLTLLDRQCRPFARRPSHAFGLSQRRVRLAEQAEDSQQRVLDEVFSVPDVAGELPAVREPTAAMRPLSSRPAPP